jgi:hypothetical protein
MLTVACNFLDNEDLDPDYERSVEQAERVAATLDQPLSAADDRGAQSADPAERRRGGAAEGVKPPSWSSDCSLLAIRASHSPEVGYRRLAKAHRDR